jgi:hypothetical protein
MFRKYRILRAKIATNVMGDDTDGLEGHLEDIRDFALLTHHPTTTGVEGVSLGRGIEDADGRASFHRHAGDALNPSAQGNDVGSA